MFNFSSFFSAKHQDSNENTKLEDAVCAIEQIFSCKQSAATVIAYIAHPETKETEIKTLLAKIFQITEQKYHNEINNLIKELFDICKKEANAQAVYDHIIDLARKNEVELGQMLFQDILRYKRDSKLSNKIRQQA